MRITSSIYELLNPNEDNKPDIIDRIYPTIHTRLYLLPNVEGTAGLDPDIIEKYTEEQFGKGRIFRTVIPMKRFENG